MNKKNTVKALKSSIRAKESKMERFQRVAEARTNKIISMIRLLGNCSNSMVYAFDMEQVTQIFTVIQQELDVARSSYDSKEKKRFSLSDDSLCDSASLPDQDMLLEDATTKSDAKIKMYGVDVATKKLLWHEVSEALTMQLTEILKEDCSCIAMPDDETYWDIRCPKPGISLKQLNQLLDFVDADEDTRMETIPFADDHAEFSCSIGLRLAQILLKRHIHLDWNVELICKDALYLIGIKM